MKEWVRWSQAEQERGVLREGEEEKAPWKPPLWDSPAWHQEGTSIQLPCIFFPLLKKQRWRTAPTPQGVGLHEVTCMHETQGDSSKRWCVKGPQTFDEEASHSHGPIGRQM